jgi:hypothetical protein
VWHRLLVIQNCLRREHLENHQQGKQSFSLSFHYILSIGTVCGILGGLKYFCDTLVPSWNHLWINWNWSLIFLSDIISQATNHHS